MATDGEAFLAQIRAMEDGLNTLPPVIVQIMCTLFRLVEEQAANIDTLLAANRNLLDIIDELKREL
jgi:hypothetical protein